MMKRIHITSKRIALFGVVLFIAGALGAAPTLYYRLTGSGSVTAQALHIAPPVSPPKPAAPTPITGHPVSISVPDATIVNLAVADGQYDATAKTWTLSHDKAHYAVMTPQPNDTEGNTFIYGHYIPEVFAYMHIIKPGAQAIIQTDNGYKFTYTLRETIAVDPAATSFLDYKGAPILTIQTCSGTWMQNRQLFIFDFKSVEKL